MTKAYINCTLYSGTEIATNKSVLVSDGTIAAVVNQAEVPDDAEVEDLHGCNLAPALIDLQIYGGNGKLFSHEPTLDSIRATYEYCLSGGAAWFMITMATNSIDKFLSGIEAVKEYQESGGKGLLGIHLEGPYIHPAKKGAHIEKFIKKPTVDEVNILLNKANGTLRMMTLAPEQCDPEIVELLLANGVIVSAGHSNATYIEGSNAFNRGIPAATHLFNAMSPFQSREPGMVGAIYDHPHVMSSIVCDGVHVNFAAVRISKQIMKERLFYITDAVTEAPDGEYQHVFRGDRYTLPDGTLSGSSLTMMQCVTNGVRQVQIPLDESLRMASYYPAKLLKSNQITGLISEGSVAAFLVFDDELNVVRTITP